MRYLDRIAITGATGFIGRHLVNHLLTTTSRPLTLIVRAEGQHPDEWHNQQRVRLVTTGPLESAGNLTDALDDAGVLVHLAGLSHVPKSAGASSELHAANVVATQKLMEAAFHLKPLKKVIYLSSIRTVANNASDDIVNDATVLTDPSDYGRSKLAAEASVQALAAPGVLALSLRPPLVIGADANGNWRSLQRLAATGLPLPFASIRNKRSFLGVDCLAEIISHLCETRFSPDLSGNYCLAQPEQFSLPETFAILRSAMGKQKNLIPFPPSIIWAAARTLRKERLAAGLVGSLQVDCCRFNSAFAPPQLQSLKETIRASGQNFWNFKTERNGN